jgi:hypothetical protein
VATSLLSPLKETYKGDSGRVDLKVCQEYHQLAQSASDAEKLSKTCLPFSLPASEEERVGKRCGLRPASPADGQQAYLSFCDVFLVLIDECLKFPNG